MDFGSYSFNTKDLPMIFHLPHPRLCAALVFQLLISIGKSKKNIAKTNMTRKANPKLGVLGPCGFLDLLRHGRCFPFVFFLPFGFFGIFL